MSFGEHVTTNCPFCGVKASKAQIEIKGQGRKVVTDEWVRERDKQNGELYHDLRLSQDERDALQKRLDEIAELADQIDTHPSILDLQDTFDENQRLVERIEQIAKGAKE